MLCIENCTKCWGVDLFQFQMTVIFDIRRWNRLKKQGIKPFLENRTENFTNNGRELLNDQTFPVKKGTF